jgi:hypothetical protein
MIISLFMDGTPLCRGEDRSGAHAAAEPDRRASGDRARGEREQQNLDQRILRPRKPSS